MEKKCSYDPVLPDAENENVKVGKNTYAYLKCIQQSRMLWKCISDAIELNYGSLSVGEIMNKEYHPIAEEIDDFISTFIFVSITENLCNKDKIVEI